MSIGRQFSAHGHTVSPPMTERTSAEVHCSLFSGPWLACIQEEIQLPKFWSAVFFRT